MPTTTRSHDTIRVPTVEEMEEMFARAADQHSTKKGEAQHTKLSQGLVRELRSGRMRQHSGSKPRA